MGTWFRGSSVSGWRGHWEGVADEDLDKDAWSTGQLRAEGEDYTRLQARAERCAVQEVGTEEDARGCSTGNPLDNMPTTMSWQSAV